MDAINALNYAPHPRASRRFWQWLYRLIFLAAIAIAAVEWGPGILRHAQSFYWEQQCLTFSQPPDHVVFEMNRQNILHTEICPPLARFIATPTNIGSAPTSTLFLHEMRRPDGTRCLLSLTIRPHFTRAGLFFFQYTEWPISFSPNYSNWAFPMGEEIEGPVSSHWKFFAGQPDPNNPSHFTFDYELNGKRYTNDAWLNNNGQLIVWRRQ